MHLDRYQQAKLITIIGALTNLFLGGIKLIGGICYHSHALIADGIHSFSDLLTDAMVLFVSKYGSQVADHTHPYGHRRIETAAILILALLLILAGLGIGWNAFDELLDTSYTKPMWRALPIAVVSIIANELLFYYTHRVGKRIQSSLIIANAWHHRSDVASSIVVAIGLLGSLFGFIYLDAIAAIIVGLMIIKVGIHYGWNSVKELVDTAVDTNLLEQIEKIIRNIDGVKKIHQLRSRMMGEEVLIDVHVLVAHSISVSEGHYIAQQVHYTLTKKLQNIKDVTVHIDPEDDEISCPSLHLPSRKTLEQHLLLSWQHDFPSIERWVLHYLDGTILIDLIVNSEKISWETLQKRIQSDLNTQHELKEIRLLEKKSELKRAEK